MAAMSRIRSRKLWLHLVWDNFANTFSTCLASSAFATLKKSPSDAPNAGSLGKDGKNLILFNLYLGLFMMPAVMLFSLNDVHKLIQIKLVYLL
jgi:hypothetical protein